MTAQNKNAAGGNLTASLSTYINTIQNNKDLQEQSQMMVAALGFLEMKAPVFPLWERGKTPKIDGGFKAATTDPKLVQEWWTKWPEANIGIPTGAVSGVWVLDIDGDEGEASLKALEQNYGDLPQSIEVITGGGGRHIYFAMPANGTIPCSASKIAKGIDVRGDGGYVVAPPSIHPSGSRYQWSVDSTDDFIPAPDWLLSLITSDAPTKGNKSPVDWVSMLQGVSEGSRNDSLARLAGKLLGHRLEPKFALYLLAAWNDARCNPPLPHDELYRTFVSIAQSEAKKRGV
jgi:hypothetical protein